MAKHNHSPEYYKALSILQSLCKEMTEAQALEVVRQSLRDFNIQLGARIQQGIDLVELMIYWQATAEDLRDFLDKNEEFKQKYESQNPEDKAEILELFEQLKEYTGFNILSGLVEVKDDKGSGAGTIDKLGDNDSYKR